MKAILYLILFLAHPSFPFPLNPTVDTSYPFHNYAVAWENTGTGSIVGASEVRSMNTVDVRRPDIAKDCHSGLEEPIYFPLWVSLQGAPKSWVEVGTWDGCDGRRYWYTYASWNGQGRFLATMQIYGTTTHKLSIWRNPVSPTEWVMSVDNVNLASYWTPIPVYGGNASAGLESYSRGAVVYGPGSQIRQLKVEYSDGRRSWWQPWLGRDDASVQPGMQGSWAGQDGIDVCEGSGNCPYTA